MKKLAHQNPLTRDYDPAVHRVSDSPFGGYHYRNGVRVEGPAPDLNGGVVRRSNQYVPSHYSSPRNSLNRRIPQSRVHQSPLNSAYTSTRRLLSASPLREVVSANKSHMRTSSYLNPSGGSIMRSSYAYNPSDIRNDNSVRASNVPKGFAASYVPAVRRIGEPNMLYSGPDHFKSKFNPETSFNRSKNSGSTIIKSSGVYGGSYLPSNGHLRSSRLVSSYVPSRQSGVNASAVRSRAYPSKMN